MVMRHWKFNHIDFSTYPEYDNDDLGVFWTPEKTRVKIWAPTAHMVELRLYKNGVGGEAFHKTNLQKNENGVWSTVLPGDYEGKYYTFRVNDGDWLAETPGTEARCVGVNGLRGQIYNSATTNPDGWTSDSGPHIQHFTDAVLYEMHVRDFSIAPNSGIAHKGKFLGLAEENTRSTAGIKTGLSHLKELGITHVHLLPVNDFASVDESKPLEKYNWGYDPQHYMALEGAYSSDPGNGTKRIREFKQLVKTLHDNGVGVVLDVVFNHTYFTKESVFNQTVPGYFYRQKPDGSFSNASGCGNELATERYMVRRYIINALKYWVNEYHVDGFRFDLMGIIDLKTMQEIRNELNQLKSGLLLYGEGWTADQSPMPEAFRATKQNTSQMPGIACFNDDFRNALKGNYGDKKSKGFVSGLSLREEAVKFGITAAVLHPQVNYDYIESVQVPWAAEPDQCINYVSCHDNYTLWDKLKQSLPSASDEELRKRVKLAGALILTSQGIPFLHAGVEFCRTKGGNGNSYKSPDSVNQIDWDRKDQYFDVFSYFQRLIRLRKNHPAFRIPRAETLRSALNFCTHYQIGVVSYCINGALCGDAWPLIVLVFNGNTDAVSLVLPEGQFKVVADGEKIDEQGIGSVVSGEIQIDPLTTYIAVSE